MDMRLGSDAVLFRPMRCRPESLWDYVFKGYPITAIGRSGVPDFGHCSCFYFLCFAMIFALPCNALLCFLQCFALLSYAFIFFALALICYTEMLFILLFAANLTVGLIGAVG